MQAHGSDTKMKRKIMPHLWYDHQAEEAARFYTSAFDHSNITKVTRYPDAGNEVHGQAAGSVMTVDFELHGQSFSALNGGPHFTFTPNISFYVTCETEEEVDKLWRKFSEGGTALMELGRYDWSAQYGWVQDRYGLTWQIALGKLDGVGQKIVPSLMYVSEHGQAEEAIHAYTSVFDDSEIVYIHRYGADEAQPEGAVMHAQFRLNGEVFMAIDTSSEHASSTFNEALSLMVSCKDQAEIDRFWQKLSEGGDEQVKQCGWLKDRFGVSWQVVPTDVMSELMEGDDDAASQRVMNAMLQMKKIDIEALRAAYEDADNRRAHVDLAAPRSTKA